MYVYVSMYVSINKMDIAVIFEPMLLLERDMKSVCMNYSRFILLLTNMICDSADGCGN